MNEGTLPSSTTLSRYEQWSAWWPDKVDPRLKCCSVTRHKALRSSWRSNGPSHYEAAQSFTSSIYEEWAGKRCVHWLIMYLDHKSSLPSNTEYSTVGHSLSICFNNTSASIDNRVFQTEYWALDDTITLCLLANRILSIRRNIWWLIYQDSRSFLNKSMTAQTPFYFKCNFRSDKHDSHFI